MSHFEFALNSELATIIMTGATTLSTVAIAVLTFFVVQENRALRRAGSSPEVVAYLSPHPDGNGSVEFILANVGRGPAFEVEFIISNNAEDFSKHNVMVANDEGRVPITVIPQDEKQRAFFGIGHVLFGNIGEEPIGPLKPFSVHVKFKDIEGRSYSHKRELDIQQFTGLYGLVNTTGDYKIAKVLESIDGRLADISRTATKRLRLVSIARPQDSVIKKVKGDPSLED